MSTAYSRPPKARHPSKDEGSPKSNDEPAVEVGMWGRLRRLSTTCSVRCKDPGPGATLPTVDQGNTARTSGGRDHGRDRGFWMGNDEGGRESGPREFADGLALHRAR